MKQLAESEVRIIILYCTQNEASEILKSAQKSNLTSNKYLWLVTQSVIGDPFDRSVNRRALPVGMLGEYLDINSKLCIVFGTLSLNSLIEDHHQNNMDIVFSFRKCVNGIFS